MLCSKRTCNAGWTCDCEGDYYCNQKDIDVYKLVNFDDYTLITDVPCQVETQKTISSSGFQLGYFHPQFSDTGLLDQECQNFVWWLDGELKNIFNTTTPVTNDNLAEVKTTLSDWNQLPIYSGSVIGKIINFFFHHAISSFRHLHGPANIRNKIIFVIHILSVTSAYRWKDAAYSCYNSISLLSINGTETDTTNSALVTHHFSNDFEDDWFGTEFVEGSTWKEHIASSTEDNYGSENTDITNTYWRIKIL